MKVIIDLLEAYSEHVELPLLLVDVDKEIKYKIFEENYFFTDCNFDSLKNAAFKQSKPTVMSVTDENLANLFLYYYSCLSF